MVFYMILTRELYFFIVKVCETTELERVQHLKDLFVKYSEMLEGIIPQKQKVNVVREYLSVFFNEIFILHVVYVFFVLKQCFIIIL